MRTLSSPTTFNSNISRCGAGTHVNGDWCTYACDGAVTPLNDGRCSEPHERAVTLTNGCRQHISFNNLKEAKQPTISNAKHAEWWSADKGGSRRIY